MTDSLIFMSYSRNELYFAEAVVQALQRAGHKVWFDLQQLEPGCNWEAEIKRGLETCSAVMVLVSRGSRTSPWVAAEWEHAVASDKPIHVMLFEPVPFDQFEVIIDKKRTTRTIDMNALQENAVNIIDFRTSFDHAVERLSAELRGPQTVRDPLPAPAFGNLPTRLPLAIWGVAAAMLLLIGILISTVIVAVNISPLLVAGCGALTIWLGQQLWAFLQRQSYRETRIALLLGIGFGLIYATWSVPFLAVGALLALFAPDVHRYSPITQGFRWRLHHPVRSERRKKVGGFWDRLAVFYGRMYGILKAFNVIFSGLILLLMIVNVLTLSGAGLGSPAVDQTLLIMTVSAILFIGHFVLNRRYHHLLQASLGTADVSGVTYTIITDPLDEVIAAQVNIAMQAACHRTTKPGIRSSVSAEEADMVIIILSDNLTHSEQERVQNLVDGKHRLIFILAAALSDTERFRPFQHYQWVDFRRQTPGMLDAMAEDVLVFGADVVSHSFGTRQTPQSFDKIIVPGRVASYLALQYFIINLNMFLLVKTILKKSNPDNVYSLLVSIPCIIISIWLVNLIIQREITPTTVLNINVGVSVVTYFISIFVQINAMPSGLQNRGTIFVQEILFGIIVMTIGYFIMRPVLRAWLSGWLPDFTPFSVPYDAFRPDWTLWKRHLLTAVVVVLLTFTFFSRLTPSGIDYPPIAELLLSGNSQLGTELAHSISEFMQE
jgi:hypothetical protein